MALVDKENCAEATGGGHGVHAKSLAPLGLRQAAPLGAAAAPLHERMPLAERPIVQAQVQGPSSAAEGCAPTPKPRRMLGARCGACAHAPHAA